MNKPIVEPDRLPAGYQFLLGRKGLSHWKNKLSLMNIGADVKSRQYLEYCELGVTKLIAEQGLLIFKEKEFTFVAQLDALGFVLYVNGLNSDGQIAKDFYLLLQSVFEPK